MCCFSIVLLGALSNQVFVVEGEFPLYIYDLTIATFVRSQRSGLRNKRSCGSVILYKVSRCQRSTNVTLQTPYSYIVVVGSNRLLVHLRSPAEAPLLTQLVVPTSIVIESTKSFFALHVHNIQEFSVSSQQIRCCQTYTQHSTSSPEIQCIYFFCCYSFPDVFLFTRFVMFVCRDDIVNQLDSALCH